MPLKRDQELESTAAKSAVAFTADRQQSRTRERQEDDREVRPSTPLNDASRQQRRGSNNSNVGRSNVKHQLAEGSENVTYSPAQVYKITVPNTMLPSNQGRPQQPPYQGEQVSGRRESKPQAVKRAVKDQKPTEPNPSIFDDTESFDISLLNDANDRDNQTVILNPQPRKHFNESNPRSKHFVTQLRVEDRSRYKLRDPIEAALGDTWQDEVRDEVDYQTRKNGYDSPHFAVRGPADVAPTLGYRHEAVLDDNYGPETPSRTQSAPPIEDAFHVSAPHKVQFNPTDQIHNLSPDVRSSEMAAEDDLGLPSMRPNSVPPVQNIYVQQKHGQQQEYRLNLVRQHHAGLPSHPDRFRTAQGPHQNSAQESRKVSAPESDVQDLSEDEPAQTNTKMNSQNTMPTMTHLLNTSTGKRSYGDMNENLDYSNAELRKKNLVDLQSEPFTHDPKVTSRPTPTDGVGNEMKLAQILENLSKVPVDAQRETFQSFTDEQWSQTGQWFVEKFQADLRELSKARLERRKIALRYEDKIRKRQSLVQHYEADVESELQELQTGGSQLVGSRKAPGASRAGTPVKTGR